MGVRGEKIEAGWAGDDSRSAGGFERDVNKVTRGVNKTRVFAVSEIGRRIPP